jgi:hypothetical protein
MMVGFVNCESGAFLLAKVFDWFSFILFWAFLGYHDMGLFWKMKIVAFVEVNSDSKYATKQRVFAIRFCRLFATAA